MNEFEENIKKLFGDSGKAWLQDLPALVESTANKYSLSELVPVDNMTFHYVAKGYQGKQPIVLKMGFDRERMVNEAKWLSAYSTPAATMFAQGDDLLLMQQAIPGYSLRTCFPKDDLLIFCDLVTRLHSIDIAPVHGVKSLKDVLFVLNENHDIPESILKQARQFRDQLLGTTTQQVLLHGDLHHDNILKHGNDWLIVDPQGYMGDPVFEVTAFLLNPKHLLVEQSDVALLIEKRVQICAEYFGWPVQRIKDWLFVKSVLCWAWALQDGTDMSYWQRLAHYVAINGT